MANEGMLVTAGISIAGSAAYALAARQVAKSGNHRRPDVILFCIAASLYLLLAGGRIVFGYSGLHSVDHAMFLVVGTPAYLSVVPIVHMTAKAISGSKQIALVVTALSAIASMIGLGAFYAGGIVGPTIDYWATEYRFGLPLAGKMLVNAVLIPALAASVVLILAGLGLEGRARIRAVAIGASVLAFFATLTSDGLGVAGNILLLERAIMAGTAIVVYVIYRRFDEPTTPMVDLPPLHPGAPSEGDRKE